jgi:hypothetical protein
MSKLSRLPKVDPVVCGVKDGGIGLRLLGEVHEDPPRPDPLKELVLLPTLASAFIVNFDKNPHVTGGSKAS